MSDAAVVCSHLSFAWPDDTPVFDDLSFTVATGRTGLVAPNGSGKSTLLKLIAGELKPAVASVAVGGTLGYLPQTLPLTGDPTVAEVIRAQLLRRPDVLLLDEPTNNLDLAGVGQLESALTETGAPAV
ncbi:ABC transporter ATP-binding protein [Streptomyces lincolnensis]|uniref:ABC transporter ATP-binding protein n=1 Tax=Streptomyces lincolnensis TaxID=1915 RepID=A0A1B1M4K8_STRLN|nr:ABC transporter ATP-binding protein [Streptomyces lincolnensis]AXG52254.1 ABC transporter ATP-binding protein [Streptomyces lincolnensis]